MTACRCRYHLGCPVHDDDGKRWDAYTIDDIARIDRVKFEPAKEGWSCYCGRHEATDSEMPAGTLCLWERTSHEYDEAECLCAEDYRDRWLVHQSIDWYGIGLAEERRHRRTRWLRRIRRVFVDLYWRCRLWWWQRVDGEPSHPRRPPPSGDGT